MKNYYANEFKDVFLYEELDKDNYQEIVILTEQFKEQENIDLSNAQWLYSTLEYFYLIAIQDDMVIGMTSEAELETLTDDFALLPFKIMIYRYIGYTSDDSKEEWDKKYLKKLQNYATWCEKQGIIVPEEDLKWIY